VHRTKIVDIAGLLEELGNVPMVAKELARELRGGTEPAPEPDPGQQWIRTQNEREGMG
jgi:hypothetical protein